MIVRTYRAAFPLLAAGLFIAACGQPDTEADNPPSASASQAGQSGTIASGDARSPSASARQEAEQAMQEVAASGDPNMRLIVALKEHRPELYEDFLVSVADLIERDDIAGAHQAGAELRPLLLEEFGAAMSTASDENLEKLVNHTIETYEEILAIDPQECVRNINGLPPENPDVIPDARQERETDIMIAIFEEGAGGDKPTASQPDLMEWMVPRLEANPEHMAAFGLPVSGRLTDKQATAFCNATIFVMEEMQKEDRARSAELFRGMTLLE